MLQKSRDPNYVKGVFSTQEIKKIGTGTTTRRTVQKGYWFIETIEGGKLECQPLNNNYVPSGPKRTITMDELIDKYSPEPEFYMGSVLPKMQELQNKVDSGDEHRQKGENFAAEHEYGTALQIDEDNVRANFGIGLTYLQRGDAEKAKNIFERLVRLEGTFEPKHKHLFNDFGISLRKSAMHHEACDYYLRAIELTAADENLYFNLARSYLELKDYNNCMINLLKVLEFDPNHETGLKFISWMYKKNFIPPPYKQQALTFIPEE